MAVITLHIGHRNYTLSCEDGEEAHLTALAKELDKRVGQLQDAVGPNTNDNVLLAMAGLMLQDEVNEMKQKGAGREAVSGGAASVDSADADAAVIEAVEAIADYVETIAARIEKG